MRQYIRHPADIPIEVTCGHPPPQAIRHIRDVSHGGLAFPAAAQVEPGIIVDIRIPFVRPMFETKARVAWCSPCANGFELGVEFLDADDAFRARMVEQICHIENYRKSIRRTEGRELTAEQAALEWIGKYAAHFPAGSDDVH